MGWYPKGAPQGATISVGAESGTDINVAIQLLDSGEQDLAEVGMVHAYLSDDSGGDGIAAAAPDSGEAIGTDGAIVASVVANLVWLLQSESDGDIDITFSDTGAFGPVYLVVVLPDGSVVVSDAIEFTA